MALPKFKYPPNSRDRTRWIETLRADVPPKSVLDPWKPYAFLHETEISQAGEEFPTATIFLTNRECPYRCLMCDLWVNTLDTSSPRGAIAAQIRYALARLPDFANSDPSTSKRSQIKLYNAGSFFDPRAIPPEDYPEIADVIAPFSRVVVECHPALVGKRMLHFQSLLKGRLEVAIGLETANPDVLDKLNKRFTVEDFRRAAATLAHNGIDLRVFLLLNPPFMNASDGLEWAKRSLDVAFDAGAATCCIIPTRGGNGAMDSLASQGHFTPPTLDALEASAEYGIRLERGRVLADLWELERFYSCACSAERASRLETINRTQTVPPRINCETCGPNRDLNPNPTRGRV